MYRMTFVEKDKLTADELQKLYDVDIIQRTDYGTTEIWNEVIQHLEDELMTKASVGDTEFYETDYTQEHKDLLLKVLGQNIYDQLLEQELDFVFLIND